MSWIDGLFLTLNCGIVCENGVCLVIGICLPINQARLVSCIVVTSAFLMSVYLSLVRIFILFGWCLLRALRSVFAGCIFQCIELGSAALAFFTPYGTDEPIMHGTGMEWISPPCWMRDGNVECVTKVPPRTFKSAVLPPHHCTLMTELAMLPAGLNWHPKTRQRNLCQLFSIASPACNTKCSH